MTRERREPRTPRTRRAARRYDPLWADHNPGHYAAPGSLVATLNDANAVINLIDALHAALWAAWRIVRRQDSVRTIFIPANDDYSVNDVRAEWARLHVYSCILSMNNAGMTCLVGARQHNWANYVLGRMLAGESIPAWSQRR
jgi:hypothetical protein